MTHLYIKGPIIDGGIGSIHFFITKGTIDYHLFPQTKQDKRPLLVLYFPIRLIVKFLISFIPNPTN
jgi:hypothetical protein